MSGYIIVGECKFFPDSTGSKHRSDGEYWYCVTHRCRTTSAAEPCGKIKRQR